MLLWHLTRRPIPGWVLVPVRFGLVVHQGPHGETVYRLFSLRAGTAAASPRSDDGVAGIVSASGAASAESGGLFGGPGPSSAGALGNYRTGTARGAFPNLKVQTSSSSLSSRQGGVGSGVSGGEGSGSRRPRRPSARMIEALEAAEASMGLSPAHRPALQPHQNHPVIHPRSDGGGSGAPSLSRTGSGELGARDGDWDWSEEAFWNAETVEAVAASAALQPSSSSALLEAPPSASALMSAAAAFWLPEYSSALVLSRGGDGEGRSPINEDGMSSSLSGLGSLNDDPAVDAGGDANATGGGGGGGGGVDVMSAISPLYYPHWLLGDCEPE